RHPPARFPRAVEVLRLALPGTMSLPRLHEQEIVIGPIVRVLAGRHRADMRAPRPARSRLPAHHMLAAPARPKPGTLGHREGRPASPSVRRHVAALAQYRGHPGFTEERTRPGRREGRDRRLIV